jgi:transmembrane sensor
MGIAKRQYFSELFRKYLENQSSSKEVDALFEMLAREDDNDLKSVIENVLSTESNYTNASDQLLKEKLDSRLRIIMNEIEQPARRVSNVYSLGLRWSAAAAVILLVVSAFFFFKTSTKPAPLLIAKKQEKKIDDVPAPAVTRAILKLDDGTIVYLDSAKNGSLAVQGNVSVVKNANGEISYNGSSKDVLFNTLVNPRGSQIINILLSDGTKVWLNAESSIHYPAAFNGNERKVDITGEAYFEVARNAAMPFVVSRNKMRVQVLGTHFNVNAYDDEAAIKVTLIEGSVKVAVDELQSRILKPNQQAEVKADGIKVINEVNTDEVIAWKNGKFQFIGKADIELIMRQIARWYDVEVVYEGKVEQHFWGSISRDINVSQVLRKFESTGGVRFRIEGKKIIVMP